MDVLLSAVASDLTGRLVSFLIRKYREPGTTGDSAVRLQRLLLRARVVVEEAEGRQIANRAMLQQLNQLRRELCRAAYAIDAFRWRATDLSRRSRRSHTRPPPSSDSPDHHLPVMVESLEVVPSDMREFVVLLGGCPRVTRQPYNTYLFMESCLFGRQMEKEEIISFLLKPSQDLDILPVIGPQEVGKRTLVEHVCMDERVGERFAKIDRLSSDELDDLRSHEHHRSMFDFTARSLMVIDIVDGNADAEESWRRFYSAVRRRAHRGSKGIIISRTEAHAKLGTVPSIRLLPPRREELWYFFRALAFGGADPDDRPDLARIAMALCEGIGNFAPFARANMIAALLQVDLSVRSWRHLFKVISGTTVLQLGASSNDEAAHGDYHHCESLRGHDAPSPCLFYNNRKLTSVAQSELPKVTLMELLTGGSLPPQETRFEVLVWQSRIPPYASYAAKCDTDNAHLQQVVTVKKQLLNKRRRHHQEDDPSN